MIRDTHVMLPCGCMFAQNQLHLHVAVISGMQIRKCQTIRSGLIKPGLIYLDAT